MIEFDEIGEWSEVKLEILRKYAAAYSRILAHRENPSLDHFYIDGFSGAGLNLSRATHEIVEGSPAIALGIDPPFKRFFFIDLDGDKANFLRDAVSDREGVEILEGDCNELLLRKVFPQVRYEDYRRALCLLDPYGLQLDWQVIAKAGELRTIDLFLNFPVMDMNRNALWRNRDRVSEELRGRMTRFWGDQTWEAAAYERSSQGELFEDESAWLKRTNDQIAEAFRQRLVQVAQFEYVARPLPMRNSRNAVVYYLFFACQKSVASGIVEEIFDKYR